MIETLDGQRFGGYATEAWLTGKGLYGTPECFLFAISPNHTAQYRTYKPGAVRQEAAAAAAAAAGVAAEVEAGAGAEAEVEAEAEAGAGTEAGSIAESRSASTTAGDVLDVLEGKNDAPDAGAANSATDGAADGVADGDANANAPDGAVDCAPGPGTTDTTATTGTTATTATAISDAACEGFMTVTSDFLGMGLPLPGLSGFGLMMHSDLEQGSSTSSTTYSSKPLHLPTSSPAAGAAGESHVDSTFGISTLEVYALA